MKTFRWFSLLFVVAALGAACSQSTVRYTAEELREFPPAVQDRIMKGEVAFGMTPQEVRYAWGAPEEVRKLTPVDGKAREEWTYTRFGVYQTKKLLFMDGRLVYMVPEPDRAQAVRPLDGPPPQTQPQASPGSQPQKESINLQEPSAR